MIYAVKAGSYYHGGNVAEITPSWGTHPIYVARRESAKKFWTKSSARKLIQSSHRAHRGNFSVEPIWSWVMRYWRGGRASTGSLIVKVRTGTHDG